MNTVEIFDIKQLQNIPDNITCLEFGFYFNQEIKPYTIPSHITCIKFGFEFNRELKPNVFPSSIIRIIFGNWYNHPLKPGIIPTSTTHLTLSWFFNQPLEYNSIPSSVTHLTFGLYYGHPINSIILPKNIKQIYITKNQIKYISPEYTFNLYYYEKHQIETLARTYDNYHIEEIDNENSMGDNDKHVLRFMPLSGRKVKSARNVIH